MKKKIWAIFALTLLPVAAGCGSKETLSDSTESMESVFPTESAVATEALLMAETEETEFSFDEPYGEVNLCDYKNLAAERKQYQITESEIDEQVELLLYDYVEYQDVNRPSQAGDYVSVTMTGTENENVLFDYTEETFDVSIGAEEFGAEFDERLTGVSIGDKLNFSIHYSADYEDAELAGLTVSYDITVSDIYEEILPELTDEFITGTLDYVSQEDMRTQLAEQLQNTYDAESEYELRENLIQQVVDNSEFISGSDALYDYCERSIDESYLSYADMFGCQTVQEVYTLFGITASEVREEALNLARRMIAVQAIKEAEQISLSEEEYNDGLARYAQEMELESVDDLLDQYDENAVRSWIIEDKVLDFLEDHAAIRNVTAVHDEETDLEEETED